MICAVYHANNASPAARGMSGSGQVFCVVPWNGLILNAYASAVS